MNAMRLALFCLILLPAASALAQTPAVATLIQAPNCYSSGTTCTIGGVIGGQAIVVGVEGYTSALTSLADSNGTLVQQGATLSTGTRYSYIFAECGAAEGTHSLTATWASGAQYQVIHAAVLGNVPTTACVSGSSIATSVAGSTGTSQVVGAPVTAANGQLLLGFIDGCCGHGVTAGTSPINMTAAVVSPAQQDLVTYGTAPAAGSTVVSATFVVSPSEVLISTVAMAGASGTYPPAASPAGGTYSSAQTVTLTSATTGAAIYYTLDGSTPTPSSTLYTAPININGTYPLAAIAVKAGLATSVSTTNYVVGAGTPAGMSLGVNGALNGYVPSPTDAWHQDISAAPVDPMSSTIITNSNGAGDLNGIHLHPDFGQAGGIPYTVIDASAVPKVPVLLADDPRNGTIRTGDIENDHVPMPIQLTDYIEQGYGACWSDAGDHHDILFDRSSAVLYEVYQAYNCGSGWLAYSTTIWDTSIAEKRPFGYTSGDAAGLSIFEGLVRYDEIVAGTINHAIRFTVRFTKQNNNNGYFTYPATHAAGQIYNTDNVIGMRLRLKASFDVSSFSATNKIILAALKKYGMILADNGSDMYFQGTPDSRWNDSDLNALKNITTASFDVVDGANSGPLAASYAAGSAAFYPTGNVYDANNHPTGAAPVIAGWTASPSTVTSGVAVTLTPNVTGASYMYDDHVGFLRGAVVVHPTATTTYTLTARSAFGDVSRPVTVTVTGVLKLLHGSAFDVP